MIKHLVRLPAGHLAGERIHPGLAQALDPAIAQTEDELGTLAGCGDLPPDAMISQRNDRRGRSSVVRTGEEREPVADRISPRPLLAEPPDRERKALLLRFFGDRTQTEIATTPGVSQTHVSPPAAKACSPRRKQLNAARDRQPSERA
ncbi:sigma factor-like helix-turn-helix DNA-binding protein [Streptosporangium sp. NBC_01756]|uniref:sigma factor-like helix-turn-helix DNA-binding protein n=1 Tax=Streptosporangium sp. NBC_01756 TaxID=2975950 RepID=UPI002DD94FC1|nr:sigma factor-like helix-turn-helix DNA-binding protein [Streptosporangium sp. NBC_01756]WSC89594.1 hypothetical protein OIE48_15850 [Streptosporangium sp. NBC_01756]